LTLSDLDGPDRAAKIPERQEIGVDFAERGRMGRRPKHMLDPNALALGIADSRYILNVWLDGSDPKIWRRFAVPGATTLTQFQVVLQIGFDWAPAGYHLHEFSFPPPGHTNLKTRRSMIDAIRYLPDAALDGPFGDMYDDDDRTRRESTGVLWELAPTPKFEFLYTYDMGDDWQHVVQVEQILGRPEDDDANFETIVCLDGERAAPFEDCGGIFGYYEMLERLDDPDERDEVREWIGLKPRQKWDPDRFSVDEINKALDKAQAKWRPRTRRKTR
jgi:hypothetical protein